MKSTPALLLLLVALVGSEAQAQHGDTWGSAETLLWWVADGPAPVPLLTTAPTNSTSTPPGALGQPDTTVLLGGREIDYPLQVGGRFTVGHWLTTSPLVGIEANYLFLGKTTNSSTVSDTGTMFLTTPFFDTAPNSGIPLANYLTVPGYANDGSATLTTSHELQGAEVNGLLLLTANENNSWSLLGGYRFLGISEDLSLATTQADSVAFFPGQFLDTFDQFQTRNYFHAGQLGLRCELTRGVFFFGSTVKVALGNAHQEVRINGTTTTNTGPNFVSQIPVTTVPGGIYAQPTNIGDYDHDRFAVLPEVTLRLGLQVTQHARIFVGYNFLYLSSVARPGSQIDGNINATQLVSFTGVPGGPLVGGAQPAPRFETTDYWAQGINLGAELSF